MKALEHAYKNRCIGLGCQNKTMKTEGIQALSDHTRCNIKQKHGVLFQGVEEARWYEPVKPERFFNIFEFSDQMCVQKRAPPKLLLPREHVCCITG